jgi:hypothetical protein
LTGRLAAGLLLLLLLRLGLVLLLPLLLQDLSHCPELVLLLLE